jgi:hypothetical protein
MVTRLTRDSHSLIPSNIKLRLGNTPGAPRGVILGGHKILSPPCVPDPKTYQTLYSKNETLKKITRKSLLFDSKPRTVVKAKFSCLGNVGNHGDQGNQGFPFVDSK